MKKYLSRSVERLAHAQTQTIQISYPDPISISLAHYKGLDTTLLLHSTTMKYAYNKIYQKTDVEAQKKTHAIEYEAFLSVYELLSKYNSIGI
jgi:hypothetical protein